MSWEEMAAPAKSWTDATAPIEFTTGKLPGGKCYVASVVLRPRRFACPAWLKPGQMVRVLRGAGENAGLLRILPDGHIKVSSSGGPNTQATVVRLPLWPGLPGMHRRAAAVFLVDEGSLEIELPPWARVVAPAGGDVAAPPGATRSAMNGKPNEERAFSMLHGKVPVAGRP